MTKVMDYLRKCNFLKRSADNFQWRLRDKSLDPPQELIEPLQRLNADSIPHSKRTLLLHLLGTYRLLKAWGVPEYVCVAGLYHSIYGTQTFKRSLTKLEERESIKKLISSQSEKLVYYLYIQDKNHLNKIYTMWQNFNHYTLTKENLQSLIDNRIPLIRIPDFGTTKEVKELAERFLLFASRSNSVSTITRLGISQYEQGIVGGKDNYFSFFGKKPHTVFFDKKTPTKSVWDELPSRILILDDFDFLYIS